MFEQFDVYLQGSQRSEVDIFKNPNIKNTANFKTVIDSTQINNAKYSNYLQHLLNKIDSRMPKLWEKVHRKVF